MTLHSLYFLSLSRTDALLVKLSLLVGQQVFYGALWGSMLVSPMVRLPASVFIVTHFDRMVSLRQQTHMLGYNHRLVVSVGCFSQSIPVVCSVTIFCHHSSLLSCPGEVSLSLPPRFKCPGAEEHA